MKTLRKLTLATLLLTLVAALPAIAQPGSGRGGPAGDGPRGDGFRDGGFGPRLEKILDLTEEQKEAIGSLREKQRGSALEQRKELMKLRHEIRGLMLEDEPDAGALEKLVRQAGALKTEMQVARTRHRLEVRKLLTDEQRDELLLHRPHRGDGPRGERQGRPGRGCDRPACDGDGPGRHPGRGR